MVGFDWDMNIVFDSVAGDRGRGDGRVHATMVDELLAVTLQTHGAANSIFTFQLEVNTQHIAKPISPLSTTI